MTIAELVSELVYGEKGLVEIAGYDDTQLRYVVCRPRGEHGQLIRRDPDLPPWVHTDANGMRIVRHPVAFGAMFAQVQESRGLNRQESSRRWQAFLQENPLLRRQGVDGAG